MTTISRSHHIYQFEPDLQPVESVRIGETLMFDVLDALGGQVQSESDILAGLDFDRVNPATGPVAIEGTEPGDTLIVRILGIDMDDHGAIVTGPGLGVLPHDMERHTTRILPVDGAGVRFGDLLLSASPMIGVIGVAPETEALPTGSAHRHGGNMDTKEIGPGSVVCLPVFQPGAMLAMGDVHAVMGDGEVCVSACEVAARIAVKVDRIRGRALDWPMVETEDAVHLLVSLPTLDEAVVEATRQAVALLQRVHRLSREEAYMLVSLAVDIGISQLVDPNKTVKASIPKSLLPSTMGDLLSA